jgi:hypothetical protein
MNENNSTVAENHSRNSRGNIVSTNGILRKKHSVDQIRKKENMQNFRNIINSPPSEKEYNND